MSESRAIIASFQVEKCAVVLGCALLEGCFGLSGRCATGLASRSWAVSVGTRRGDACVTSDDCILGGVTLYAVGSPPLPDGYRFLCAGGVLPSSQGSPDKVGWALEYPSAK